jgi:integrase
VTAKRVRGRIENVLSAAKVDGYRDGLNPARWQDNLAPKFKNRKQKAKKHHAAVPFEEMPAFMVELKKLSSTSARALEFVILTAVRTGEARKATWSEIDFDEKTWTIPASHMKRTKQTDEPEDHCVPLCDRAIEILEKLKPGKPDELIFKVTRDARTRGKALSDQAMLEVVRGIREGFTTHGMRSSFRDWVGEVTNYPSDLGELALAHKIKNATEAAYRRRKGLEKRRPMMGDWASYLAA